MGQPLHPISPPPSFDWCIKREENMVLMLAVSMIAYGTWQLFVLAIEWEG